MSTLLLSKHIMHFNWNTYLQFYISTYFKVYLENKGLHIDNDQTYKRILFKGFLNRRLNQLSRESSINLRWSFKPIKNYKTLEREVCLLKKKLRNVLTKKKKHTYLFLICCCLTTRIQESNKKILLKYYYHKRC